MSHGGGPSKFVIRNVAVFVFTVVGAFMYEFSGSTFLSGYYDLTSPQVADQRHSVPNLDGIPTGQFFPVTKVTDGDTIHVKMGGEEVKVRLIGINTPETVDPRRPVQCFGKEASAYMKSLVGGGEVRLETDPSQDTYDAYHRLLAYVYMHDGQMVNRKMIADGYAYEYTYMKPYRYQKEFREIQNIARASGKGLWAQDTCAGKK